MGDLLISDPHDGEGVTIETLTGKVALDEDEAMELLHVLSERFGAYKDLDRLHKVLRRLLALTGDEPEEEQDAAWAAASRAAAGLPEEPRPTRFDGMPGGGVCWCLNPESPLVCEDCPAPGVPRGGGDA